jgi:hypothetical protein
MLLQLAGGFDHSSRERLGRSCCMFALHARAIQIYLGLIRRCFKHSLRQLPVDHE